MTDQGSLVLIRVVRLCLWPRQGRDPKARHGESFQHKQPSPGCGAACKGSERARGVRSSLWLIEYAGSHQQRQHDRSCSLAHSGPRATRTELRTSRLREFIGSTAGLLTCCLLASGQVTALRIESGKTSSMEEQQALSGLGALLYGCDCFSPSLASLPPSFFLPRSPLLFSRLSLLFSLSSSLLPLLSLLSSLSSSFSPLLSFLFSLCSSLPPHPLTARAQACKVWRLRENLPPGHEDEVC
eukprot:138291-Hanusia_phi.AAC.2